MNDTRTDDEIAGLFAAANPLPAHRSAPDRSEIGLPPTDEPASDLDDGALRPLPDAAPRERWGLVVGVAAAVALVVSLAVTTTVGEGEPAPADEPDDTVSTLSTLPAPEPTAVDRAKAATIDAFLEAIARHDVDAARQQTVASPELVIAPGAAKSGQPIASLADQFTWMEAFDWRWDDAECEPFTGGRVACEIRIRNRLTDFSGVDYLALAVFGFVDDRIATVTHFTRSSRSYSSAAFQPYAQWMEEHHPDDVSRLWSDQGPHLNAETAAIMDARLTEYVGQIGEELAYEFIAAVNDGDAEAARAVLAPDRTPQLVWDENGSLPTLEAQLAWLGAFHTTWDAPQCAATRPNSVACEFRYGNRLSQAQHGQTEPGSVTFRIVDGGIEMTRGTVPADGPPPATTYDAFIYWVNATDPETAHRIWTNGDEGEIVTEASASLLDEQLSEFLASGVVDLQPDDAAASRLVTALNERDADALAATVDDDLDAIDGWARPTWSEMATWLDANGESWKVKACHPVAENAQGCEIDVEDALSRFAGVEKNRFAVLEVGGDVVTAFSITTQSDAYAERALRPFLDWLRTNHPDDVDEVWQEVDGALVPRPTARAAELHARHVAEYTTTEGES